MPTACFRVLAAALAIYCLVASAGSALACKVPVFRYALEHWQPDPYLGVVLHRGPLSEEDEALVAKLERRTEDPSNYINLVVKRVDVEKEESAEIPILKSLGEDIRKIKSPEIVLFYPQHSQSGPLAWRGAITAKNINAIVDSPARQQITKWIIDGESAVWVLVGVGDKKKDKAAEEKLRKELARLEKEIKLTDLEIIEAEEEFGKDTKVELRLGFKLLVVDRDDPKEKILAATLLRSESDLLELNEPIAIPVFGRGRSHLALAGKGINAEMIEESCRFLAGDCSCEVKSQNPGVDLLFAVNWDDLVVGSAGSGEELPPLAGVGLYQELELDDLADKPDDPAKRKPTDPEDTTPKDSTTVADKGEEPTGEGDTKLAFAQTAPPKQPKPPADDAEALAQTTPDAASETDDEAALDASSSLAERLVLWVAGLVALGAVVVIASTFWLRSQSTHQ